MLGDPGEVTQLIHKLRSGAPHVESRLAELIYSELRRIAAAKMRGERPDHTLTPTALANEAWLRFRDSDDDVKDRQHFLAIAANAMRRVLIDHARARSAAKRGHRLAISLDDINVAAPQSDEHLVALDAALDRLAKVNARAAKVVELQFFGGLKQQEIAELLNVERRTVVRDWTMARAWLYRSIGEESAGTHRPDPTP